MKKGFFSLKEFADQLSIRKCAYANTTTRMIDNERNYKYYG